MAISVDGLKENDKSKSADGANTARSDGEETKGDGGGGFSAYIVSFGQIVISHRCRAVLTVCRNCGTMQLPWMYS